MSALEFGNNVEESRRKLQEVLALVHSGHDHAIELEGRFSEFEEFENSAEETLETFETLDEFESEFEEQCDDWAEKLESAKQLIQEEIDGFQEKAIQWMDELEDFADDASETVERIHEKAEAGAEQLAEEFQGLVDAAKAVEDQLVEIRYQTTELLRAVDTELVDFVRRHSELADAFVEKLQTFHGNLLPEYASKLEQSIAELRQEIDGRYGYLMEGIKERGIMLQGLFETFGNDSANLKQEFVDKLSGLWDELKRFAGEELDSTLQESLQKVLEEGIESFAKGVIESVVLTQVGVATSSAMAPAVPGIVAAKKLAEFINSVL